MPARHAKERKERRYLIWPNPETPLPQNDRGHTNGSFYIKVIRIRRAHPPSALTPKNNHITLDFVTRAVCTAVWEQKLLHLVFESGNMLMEKVLDMLRPNLIHMETIFGGRAEAV